MGRWMLQKERQGMVGARAAVVVVAALSAASLPALAQDLPTVTITFVGNAQSVGAVDMTTLDIGFPLVCGFFSQGAPGCGLPAGQACCVKPVLPEDQGRTVTLRARGARGIAGGGSGIFSGWGGACAQAPQPCPFDPDLVSPALLRDACLGGVDRRGELLSGTFRGATSSVSYGCELTLPSTGNVDVVLHFNKVLASEEFLPPIDDIVLPPACTGLPVPECSSPPRDSTAAPPPITCGDPNFDGSVTEADADEALRAATGGIECLLNVCDANGDGQLTAGDALEIFRRAAGLSPEPLDACPAP